VSDGAWLIATHSLKWITLLTTATIGVAANEQFSIRVLVITECTLIQAANDEKWIVGQCTCRGPNGQGFE